MPNILQASILGLVQGLTEFLPISSSGHLVLFQKLMGLSEPILLFDVAVHVGTLAAVLAVFRSDILDMIKSVYTPGAAKGVKLMLLIIVGSVPTAVIGLLLKDTFESMFASVTAVGTALLFTGVLLMATRLAPEPTRDLDKTRSWHAMVIGVFQGLAITPGISRSGATISIALLMGIERDLAARLSFLLSIPAIVGALALHLLELPEQQGVDLMPMIVGGAAAALSGYVALRLLLGLVRGGRLHWFAYYCWALGLTTLIFWS